MEASRASEDPTLPLPPPPFVSGLHTWMTGRMKNLITHDYIWLLQFLEGMGYQHTKWNWKQGRVFFRTKPGISSQIVVLDRTFEPSNPLLLQNYEPRLETNTLLAKRKDELFWRSVNPASICGNPKSVATIPLPLVRFDEIHLHFAKNVLNKWNFSTSKSEIIVTIL